MIYLPEDSELLPFAHGQQDVSIFVGFVAIERTGTKNSNLFVWLRIRKSDITSLLLKCTKVARKICFVDSIGIFEMLLNLRRKRWRRTPLLDNFRVARQSGYYSAICG
jgi:hypothetical protein